MSDEIPETLEERYGDAGEPDPTFAEAQPDGDTTPEPTFATAHDWPDHDPDLVAEIRAAEAAQQASMCVIPDGDFPEDLDRALERRVQVNLAQHGGGPVRRVGGADPQVRELEAPYSRRRAAGSIDHTQEGQS